MANLKLPAGRLPPLNALRAFEAAARLLSFSLAAQELRVTPGAISQQVKLLEDLLGVRLFRRLNRAVVLTEAGRACWPVLHEGFERLAEGVALARTRPQRRLLTVSVAPSFAAKWLMPRLDRFRDAYPDIDLRLDASMQLVDFGRESVDAAIRYGSGRYPGLYIELLLRNEVFPVCSPRLLEGPQPLVRPADLRHHVLLHDESSAGDRSFPDWPMWLKAAGINDVDATRGPRFNLPNLVLEAAVAGRGVALGLSVLAADDLAAGRLVRPFGGGARVDFAYYFVCPPGAEREPAIAAFRRWLADEVAAHQQAEAGTSQSAPAA